MGCAADVSHVDGHPRLDQFGIQVTQRGQSQAVDVLDDGIFYQERPIQFQSTAT